MKKKAVAVLTAISILIAGLTGCQTATKSYGGKTTIKLEPNQKLEEITWKDNSLWYLTRILLKPIHSNSSQILESLKEQ